MKTAPTTTLPSPLRAHFRSRRWGRVVLLCALLTLLSACWQAPPSLDTATERFSPAGGSIALPGGVAATVSAGFLNAPADVTVTLSDSPEAYPEAVAAAYPAGAAEPTARGVTVSFPSAALGTTGELAVRVPTVVPRLEEEERLLAEVHLFLADGQHMFFFQPYARVDSVGQPTDATDTVTVSAAQLSSVGAVRVPVVRVSVRPVRLSPDQLEPQALPGGFVLEDVVTDLNQGVAFDFAEGGRIFIAEKAGVVRVAENGVLRKTPFIDLSKQVNSYNARGLLGFTLHPLFPRQPYAYLLYTYDPPEVQGKAGYGGPDNAGARVARLVRVTADAAQNYSVAVPGSERVLLGKGSTYAAIGDPAARNSATPSCGPLGSPVEDCIPSDEISHTIGAVRFGLGGSLFVSTGDGSDFTKVRDYVLRAQELDSLAGKLLRIDPETGQGYRDNPFYDGNPGSNRSKVYSYGMRNPFRFTVHPQTGEPFIGDVGWNTWEEVNTGRGKNFGWPCFEGGSGKSLQQGGYRALAGCQALYKNAQVTPALYAYLHGSGGSSVQVGDFYTGERYPAEYRGALFVNDFNQGLIRTLHLSGSGALLSAKNFMTVPGVVQMRAGPGGDLYLINIYDGTLKRLRYDAPDAVPLKAVAGGTPLSGAAPLTVQFSSAGSSGSGTLLYSWDFGNGAGSSEANPGMVFDAPGNYPVVLSVSDAAGEVSRSGLTVRVGNALPTVKILSPATDSLYRIGQPVPFNGLGSDPDDGELPEEALSWTLKTHHNAHVHSDGLPPTTGSTGSFVPEDHGDNTSLELCLTARDSLGESASDCVSLRPQTAAYTLATVPRGLELPWEGVLRKTPFTVHTIVGGTQQLIAPARQGRYSFVRWSDGGAALHDITVTPGSKRLVASYRAGKRASFTALCRNRWRVTNHGAAPLRYSWRVLQSGRTGSGTALPNRSLTLTLPSGNSRVTFSVGGVGRSTVPPKTQLCRQAF